MDDTLEKINNFENICKAELHSNKSVGLIDVLKIKQNDQTVVFNGNGNRLSYSSVEEYVDECR